MREINCKVYFALFWKKNSEERLCSGASRQKLWGTVVSWDETRWDESARFLMCLLNVCLGSCLHRSRREESTITHLRKTERGWQSFTGYTACCVVWENVQKTAIEVAAENELSAVILFIRHVSLPEAVYFKAFKVRRTKGDFPICCLIVHKGWKHLESSMCWWLFVVGFWLYCHMTGQAVTTLCVFFSAFKMPIDSFTFLYKPGKTF